MTWRSLIFFEALLGFNLLPTVAPLAAASLTGRVELKDSRDPAVSKAQDYSGVVVWLESVTPISLPHTSAKAQAIQPAKAQIIQKDKRFVPHILAVAPGTRVDFPNLDPIFHNAFSNFRRTSLRCGAIPTRNQPQRSL